MENYSLLLAIVTLMGAAVIMVPLFKHLGLGSVLGYLTAGCVVGPWGFGVTTEVETLRQVSEFGVVFLLFIVGLELQPKKLWEMRNSVFGLGTAQMVVTAVATALYLIYLNTPVQTALILGTGIALSSTAIVLQILSEKGELQTKAGRGTFAILLMQDIIIVPLLAVIPLLADNSDIPTPHALWATISLVGVILGTRYLIVPAIGYFAHTKNQDIFGAAAVLCVLIAALIMQVNHLSMALGAFLVGLTLSSSEFRHQIEAEVRPFKGYLLGLFFMAIGMTLDFQLMLRDFWTLMAHLIGIFLLKGLILYALARLWKYTRRDAIRISFLLAQCGEFGFVLFGIMYATGMIGQEVFQSLLVFVALTMVIAPFWEKLGNFFIERLPSEENFTDLGAQEAVEIAPKCLIIGFSRFGQSIAHLMQEMEIPYVAVEISPRLVKQARKNGFNVIYGDAHRVDLLDQLGVDQDTVVVITSGETMEAKVLVRTLNSWHPGIDILCRAHNLRARDELLAMDVTEAIPETLEASLRLGEIALWRVGGNFEKIAGVLNKSRRDGYKVIREQTLRKEK